MTSEEKNKILAQLKEEFYERYGYRINENLKREPKRKTYYLDHLYFDLDKVLDSLIDKNNLSERTVTLIAKGLQVCGNHARDAYAYICENLYADEAKDVRDFLDYIEENDLSFGRFNYEELWSEFKNQQKTGNNE